MIECYQNNCSMLQSELNRLIGQQNQFRREIEFAHRNNLNPAPAEQKIASLHKKIERLRTKIDRTRLCTPQLDFKF